MVGLLIAAKEVFNCDGGHAVMESWNSTESELTFGPSIEINL
jgi:hypothetical protein